MSQPKFITRTPRAIDLWELSFSAMRQQKVRTVLTIIGVVVGTFALVLSLAVGRGVDRAIVNLFREDDRLRKIQVTTKYEESIENVPAESREPKGDMSDAKRARIRQALIRTLGFSNRPQAKLTPDVVRKLAALEHVASAIPLLQLRAEAVLDGQSEGVSTTSVTPENRSFWDRLIAGRLFTPEDGRAAIVHEFLLYHWGLVRDEDAVAAIGRTFRLVFRWRSPDTFDLSDMIRGKDGTINPKQKEALESALKRLAGLVPFLPLPRQERDVLGVLFDHVRVTSRTKPLKTYSEDFQIVGVLREWDEKDKETGIWAEFGTQRSDILLPTGAAVAFAMKVPEIIEEGYDTVSVTVDREENVKELARRIEKMGFRQWSLGDFIDTVRMNVLLISMATAFIAIVALVVAAIGITNTMIMSVLERTHEVGIMKALGARDRHIRLMFLVEGMSLGLVGSGLGLALAWVASFPGDAIARRIMESQPHMPVKESLFAFPPWLVLGIPGLVCLITTLAALYPANRAARLDPVTSLRHD